MAHLGKSWGKNGTRAEICRNFKKFLFSLKFPVKTGKKVGILKFLQISALVPFLPQGKKEHAIELNQWLNELMTGKR